MIRLIAKTEEQNMGARLNVRASSLSAERAGIRLIINIKSRSVCCM